jgi:hypothetical protein
MVNIAVVKLLQSPDTALKLTSQHEALLTLYEALLQKWTRHRTDLLTLYEAPLQKWTPDMTPNLTR